MREIKFRAWDTYLNKMVIWDQLIDKSKWILTLEIFNNPSFLFMQSTGLKDKNGREIYEGDVVNVNNYGGTPRYEKVHYYTNAGFAGVHPFTDSGYHWSANNCEIVGNMHENPELVS